MANKTVAEGAVAMTPPMRELSARRSRHKLEVSHGGWKLASQPAVRFNASGFAIIGVADASGDPYVVHDRGLPPTFGAAYTNSF
jgi:hypothetical protein